VVVASEDVPLQEDVVLSLPTFAITIPPNISAGEVLIVTFLAAALYSSSVCLTPGKPLGLVSSQDMIT
jgi:hypothetical protein